MSSKGWKGLGIHINHWVLLFSVELEFLLEENTAGILNTYCIRVRIMPSIDGKTKFQIRILNNIYSEVALGSQSASWILRVGMGRIKAVSIS